MMINCIIETSFEKWLINYCNTHDIKLRCNDPTGFCEEKWFNADLTLKEIRLLKNEAMNDDIKIKLIKKGSLSGVHYAYNFAIDEMRKSMLKEN